MALVAPCHGVEDAGVAGWQPPTTAMMLQRAVFAAVPEAVLTNIVAEIPVQHLGQPADVARAVTFLAAQDAGFIIGATLAVNGGQYMS